MKTKPLARHGRINRGQATKWRCRPECGEITVVTTDRHFSILGIVWGQLWAQLARRTLETTGQGHLCQRKLKAFKLRVLQGPRTISGYNPYLYSDVYETS